MSNIQGRYVHSLEKANFTQSVGILHEQRKKLVFQKYVILRENEKEREKRMKKKETAR